MAEEMKVVDRAVKKIADREHWSVSHTGKKLGEKQIRICSTKRFESFRADNREETNYMNKVLFAGRSPAFGPE